MPTTFNALLPSWGETLTMLGFIVGGMVWLWESRRRNLNTEGMLWVAISGLFCGVVIARLGQLMFSGSEVAALHAGGHLGGKSLVAGLLGGWLGVELAKRKLGLTRSTGDLWALALPAGEAVGRLGCYLNGCCFGREWHGPWAVWQHDAWRHPAQLYASLIALTIFVLVFTARDKLTREGDLFRLFLLLYAIGRFFLEFFRAGAPSTGGFSVVQWICVGVGIWAVKKLLELPASAQKPARA